MRLDGHTSAFYLCLQFFQKSSSLGEEIDYRDMKWYFILIFHSSGFKRSRMLKQTLKIVSYLIISLLIGIAVTLLTDSIENITVEKKIRKDIEADIRNAVASFKDSAPHSTSADETAFIERYTATVMGDKVAAGVPPEGAGAELLYLFTLKEKERPIDFYMKKPFLKSELAILDIPDYISGIVATIIAFTFIIFYTENKKRALSLKQQFELKHAELSRALERHEALALLGRMSATLAHELKTPLSTISNLLHVLPSRFSDEQFTKRFVTLVREELDRTQQLIDNLLAYGKQIELRNEAWVAMQALLLPAANGHHLTMIPDMPADAEILGDRFYLDLLFQNIFRNSREAGADEVSVAVRTPHSATESFVEIICEDNGAGYPAAADLDELTNPFVTSRSRGGGLGLYLAKKIVTAHEGTLSLFRREKGAGVKIILPGRRVRTNGEQRA